MGRFTEVNGRRAELGGCCGSNRRTQCRRFVNQTPDALSETMSPFNPCFSPDDVAFRWGIRQHEKARRIRPIEIDNIVGIDCISLRL